MANKKESESTKKVIKKNTNTTKSNKTATKKTSTKPSTNKTKTTTKKTTTKPTTKKTNQVKKNIQPKENEVKKEIVVEEKVKNVELANVLEDEKFEIVNLNVAKVEDAKTIKKKSKKLLMIGIFIAILGIIALFVSLIANRIVDREFLSDNAITFMMVCSIIIEGFGAFIIINEA